MFNATVGQGKMAAAGWYKVLLSFCTKLPTPVEVTVTVQPTKISLLMAKTTIA
jgi:hypothetical protein